MVVHGVQALHHDVWFLGLVDFYHFHVVGVCAYDFWERGFTDFALELGEIVRGRQAHRVLLDLVVDPLPQTHRMDQPTVPFALARRYQRVLFRLLVTQTNLAVDVLPIDILLILFLAILLEKQFRAFPCRDIKHVVVVVLHEDRVPEGRGGSAVE